MSFGHDFEDAILALVDEARLNFTAAQEPVDGLIDQTQAPRRSKACAGVETDGQRGTESVHTAAPYFPWQYEKGRLKRGQCKGKDLRSRLRKR